MKKIYVAHPYQAKQENFAAIANICNRLVSMGLMPISPVHAFRFLDDQKEFERRTALKFCRELLPSCDEVWFFGDWEHSVGCRMEFRVAQEHLVPVRIVEGWKEGQPIFREA